MVAELEVLWFLRYCAGTWPFSLLKGKSPHGHSLQPPADATLYGMGLHIVCGCRGLLAVW